ncbi:F-box domain-containing protein [Mycena venus]|uniref:F-box domain-containing protein n=1 Tax=Mycena venus TaxID=2733690 RepID=A0A8H6U415_9AGAR|nr:F-box domain-containing protein [Mycena venus]
MTLRKTETEMSVADLEARIAKLSVEIDVQKDVLKKLEQDKVLAQRQLNTMRDPVARLPFEISSEIFVQSLAPFPKPGASHVPMLLLNICNGWSAIALSTPTLWAAMHIASPCSEGIEELLLVWIEPARNRPLSILLDGCLDESAAAIVWRHGRLLNHLEIDPDGFSDYTRINLFGDVTPGPLPLLETLTIRNSNWDTAPEFSGPQVLELLRLTPNLDECILDGIHPVCDLEAIAEVHAIPNLRRLMFGAHGRCPDSDDDLLRYLTLPALQTLHLSMRYGSADDLFSFLQRSSPPLQDLVIGEAWGPIDLVRLHECLTLMPSLTRFELWGGSHVFVPDFLSALTDSTLLLNLRSLILHLDAHNITDSFWMTLLRALSARRTQLQMVNIGLTDLKPSRKPAGSLLDEFRGLVADGMQINITADKSNLMHD